MGKAKSGRSTVGSLLFTELIGRKATQNTVLYAVKANNSKGLRIWAKFY